MVFLLNFPRSADSRPLLALFFSKKQNKTSRTNKVPVVNWISQLIQSKQTNKQTEVKQLSVLICWKNRISTKWWLTVRCPWFLKGFVDAAVCSSSSQQSIPTRDIHSKGCSNRWDVVGYWDSASASHAPLEKKLLCIRLCRLNWYGSRIVFFLDRVEE